MFFYYARHFEAGAVGSRIVAVQCDKCGCEYSFELARVGSGSVQAPYGIGTKRAARTAEERAQRDLGKRLEHDAELVPCPKWAWINEELVSRYRRGRYRGNFILGAAFTAALWLPVRHSMSSRAIRVLTGKWINNQF